MTSYCSICGEELAPEEEAQGICESCKLSQSQDHAEDIDEIEPDMR